MIFEGVEFTWMAEVTDTVPIISIGGIAKRYLVPGWRLGWVVIYDKQNLLKHVRFLLVDFLTFSFEMDCSD
jgi:tyrosine aminotransferase